MVARGTCWAYSQQRPCRNPDTAVCCAAADRHGCQPRLGKAQRAWDAHTCTARTTTATHMCLRPCAALAPPVGQRNKAAPVQRQARTGSERRYGAYSLCAFWRSARSHSARLVISPRPSASGPTAGCCCASTAVMASLSGMVQTLCTQRQRWRGMMHRSDDVLWLCQLEAALSLHERSACLQRYEHSPVLLRGWQHCAVEWGTACERVSRGE